MAKENKETESKLRKKYHLVVYNNETYEEKANEAIDKTNDYFISNGGTCEIIYEGKN